MVLNTTTQYHSQLYTSLITNSGDNKMARVKNMTHKKEVATYNCRN